MECDHVGRYKLKTEVKTEVKTKDALKVDLMLEGCNEQSVKLR
jgi:hypothetical protein